MKRANTIIMLSVGISLVFFVPALFSQGSTGSESSPQKQAAPEAAPDIKTPQAPKDKVDIKSDAIERSIPSYRMRLKDILKEAEENIKKVSKELSEQEISARNRDREAKVAEAFENGNQLYKEGKLKEAKEEWGRALGISKDPEMKNYIEEAARRAGEEDRRVEAEARARSERKRLEAQEKARLEREAEKKAESDARERARLEIESARKLEAEQKERVRLEREYARKFEAEQKERVRLEKESARKAEAEAAERARLEREAARKSEEIARETRARQGEAEKVAREEVREREAKESGKMEADRIESARKEKAGFERDAARKAETEARGAAREEARLEPEREAAEKAKAAVIARARQAREDAKMAETELREKEESAQFEKEAAEVQNMNAAVFGKKLEGLYREAIGYYKNGDIDKAKSVFMKIVRLYPNQTTAQRYLDKNIPKEMRRLLRSR